MNENSLKNEEIESQNRIPVTARGWTSGFFCRKNQNKSAGKLHQYKISSTVRDGAPPSMPTFIIPSQRAKIHFTGFGCFLHFKGLYIIFVNQLFIIFFLHNFVARIKHLIVLTTTKRANSPIHPIIKTRCLYLFEKNTKKMSSPSDGACRKRCLHSENIFTALPGWSWTSHLGSRTRHKGNR